MTKDEILALPNLSIAEETQHFIHIHAVEGYTITPWNSEKQDIRDFYESECYYFPKLNDFGNYKVITKAESDEYHRLQEIALEEDRQKEEEEKRQRELELLQINR